MKKVRRCCGALQFCSKTKCTLINTRTQATLALGARWNGWGAFLSSSERNTLGEGVFPVIHSRNALLLLIKAQPFQRPRQQPQQLQLAAAATSSSCHNKATNPPQRHEHTCCCKNFGSMEIGSGMGWCTHGVTGQATPYATAYGYPAWSRECKSTSGSSGAEAGSRTVTGDDSSVGGSGEGLPLEGRAFTSYRRPHPRASSDRGGAVDGSSSLSAPGREGRTEVTGAAQFPLGLESLPRSMKRPRHPVALEEELEHASPEVVAGEEPEAPPINPSALVPVIDLFRLSPSDLATHLSDVARLEVAMPLSSPRLRVASARFWGNMGWAARVSSNSTKKFLQQHVCSCRCGGLVALL